ncbi:SGNH/GDSL hydrolase family protein [Promicromonospora sp. NPDC090134]|uniref:SGNH/GDSL hydrolase family protein n=1 Tax=Promicromonospora sp. NPDC090134 TaxID=3364408 RepID=UPI0038049BE3
MMTKIDSASEYVALGSSYAAGPGLKPRADGSPRPAGRSAANYAHLFAQRRSLRLVDMTYSGAVSADLLSAGKRGPAQLDAVTTKTRLVTITAGGNDIGYLPTLTLSSLPARLGHLPRLARRIRTAMDPSVMEKRLADLESQLGEVASTIRGRSPHAEIVFVDYLTILPLEGEPAHPLNEEVIVWGRAAARKLGETYAAVAAREDCRFLSVGARSAKHHAWSKDPWTRRFHLSLSGGAPYHPNAEGMERVAGMLDDILEGDSRARR